jgi:antitoxin component YwqK of YwqJK toxin-antitoxin module
MKKGIILPWLVCCVISIAGEKFSSAQENALQNGYTQIYYPTGKISSEGTMKNGKPDGYWKTYFPSGVMKSEGNRRNLLLDSIWVFYNEKGDTLQKINYVFGKKNGYTITYNTEEKDDPINYGKIMSKELYVNDKKEGLSYFYYNNGILHEVVGYKGNKKHGTSYEYNMDGGIITIEKFSNGVLTDRQKINRSDDHHVKQGLWQEYYDNGSIKKEMYYKNGELDGLYKEYAGDGNLSLKLNYKNGVIVEEADTNSFDVDVVNKYDDYGNLIFTGTYRLGVPVGIHRQFDSLGNVTNAMIYNEYGIITGKGIITKEGKKEGEWNYLYDNGSVKAKGKYLNNLESGKWNYYTPVGKIEQTGSYKAGKYDGLWTWYYKEDSVKREEEYFNGKEEGEYVEYDEKGNTVAQGKYYDGEREGEWLYKVNDFLEKGSYIGGLRDGKWQAFYQNGKLRYEGNYIQGNPEGLHKFYYENGNIKEEQYYISGLREKNWKKYDPKGDLILTITYRDDTETRINGEKLNFEKSDIKLLK